MRTLFALLYLALLSCQSGERTPIAVEEWEPSEAKLLVEWASSGYSDCIIAAALAHKDNPVPVSYEMYLAGVQGCLDPSVYGADIENVLGYLEPMAYLSRNQGTLSDYYTTKGIDIESVPAQQRERIARFATDILYIANAPYTARAGNSHALHDAHQALLLAFCAVAAVSLDSLEESIGGQVAEIISGQIRNWRM